MNNEVSHKIDSNILNIFTSKHLDDVLRKYNLDKYYHAKQIHSTIVNIVDDNYQNETVGDALITNKINTPLVIKTADCIPIILYDKENKVIATIHSGWLGTLNNIVSVTINKMIKTYNSTPSNIYAYIYPSIRQCHFEVDIDVYLKFKDKIKEIDKYTNKRNNKYYINLQEIVKDNIKEFGITNITDSNICTYCNHDTFHSYRYNKTDKRNILIALIKE